MTFHNSTLADEIANRAAAMLAENARMSRDDVTSRLLAEDRRNVNQWGSAYSRIVSEVMLGERAVVSSDAEELTPSPP
jgi:hypothetical protein